MKKGLIINSADAHSFRSIVKRYEFETENINSYQIRAYYFDDERFDFYPKSKKIFDLRKQKWVSLDNGKGWKHNLSEFLALQIFED